MNNEIKEILDMLKQHISIISVEDEDLLLDYIINLQEEYEHLSKSYYNLHEKYYKIKKNLENKNIILKGVREERNYLCSKLSIENKYLTNELNTCMIERNNFLSRIDKAINKMQDIRDLGFDYDGFNNVKDLKGLIDDLVDLAGQSIDILRGDKE